MKFMLRGASQAAILFGLAGVMPAWGQQVISVTQETGPQQVNRQQVERTGPQAPQAADQAEARVIVTGSLIVGSAEDAALPVEVYSAEELEEQGSPTALEFVKTLTISGPTTGEAYYFGGAGSTGSPSFNLRGIGADKTLTLLNGRRVTDNASNIPAAAIARTEILKDGAAVTYGADATGGVVNFITRDSFNGLEARAQYKYIDGSDGDYGISLLGGFGEGNTNFMWSAEWEHRSVLDTLDRPGITDPSFNFDIATGGNPAPWSTLTNLAGYLALGPRPTAATANTRTGEFGSPVSGTVFSDFTPQSCAAVGGFFVNSFTCNYNYIPYYNLVENQDIYRLFGQLNTTISDNIDFHLDASYGEVSVPQVFGSPSQPVVRGPARAEGLTYQFYVPRTNPGFQDFAVRSGLAANPAFANVGGVMPITFRPLAHGGNPVLGEGNGFGVPSRINNQSWRVMSSLSGNLGDVSEMLGGVNFDVSATFNQQNFEGDAPDIIGYRFQDALNGFGGPNCRAADLNPLQFGIQNDAAAGRDGCLYWNPFASNFANQPERNLANPNYNPALANSLELYRWLQDPRKTESQTQSLTIDAIFSGETGVQLPGGVVSWGLGTQWRQVEFKETVRSNFYNGNTPCIRQSTDTTGVVINGVTTPFPQVPLPQTSPYYTGCAGGEGPFLFFDINPPDAADRQQFSYFGELALPVFDTLNFTAAVRREDFSGGLGATVYKISGKWDVFGPISLRGSYGTNYSTPPLGIIPGRVENLVRSYDRANRNWKAFQRTTAAGLQPETATAWNAGAIWQSQGIASDHDFQFIVDYFDIQTEDEIGELADHNQILAATTLSTTINGFNVMNCAAPLISLVSFNQHGPNNLTTCQQGVTTSDNFSVIRSVLGNAFGQTTKGLDIQARYSMPVGAGDLTFDVTGTRVTEQTTSQRTINGVVVSQSDDRLGNLNFSTVGVAVPEWRVNAYSAYRWGPHILRLQLNYVSAVTDERAGIQYGENGEDWVTGDIYYNLDITEDMRLSLSIANIFDQDPPPAQVELGYDPRTGSPLGRTIEVGLRKTF
ncbi:TonB-dependent receptor plug domain-containing protein [bacterium]|nr:TonB-dependent receptor plug domain-containing protein [bacterium]